MRCILNTPPCLQELAAELASAPGKLLSIVCDVRKEDQILNMFQFTKDKFGGVDVCICNAGLAHNSTILGGDTSDWRDMWEVSDTTQGHNDDVIPNDVMMM